MKLIPYDNIYISQRLLEEWPDAITWNNADSFLKVNYTGNTEDMSH